jgi:hypothetical protein
MAACRSALEEASATRVALFAYPYGAVDAASADTARALFEFACDCRPRVLDDSFDAARVPRLDVKAWDPETLAARVAALGEIESRLAIRFLP